jgi:hypothetical protein
MEQMSIDATVMKRIDQAAGSELVHVPNGSLRSWRASERSLGVPAVLEALVGSPNQMEAVTARFEKRNPTFAEV